ncbi:MAG: sigma-54-dependent Fis family transcriptional regulator [Blastocatellia bacterium]|nr:MAG: sigma-54-dependent Fis family transcriptional regulator [Blastocatellia bacterium]
MLLPRLIAVAGPLSGTSLPLDRAEIAIGRDAVNDVALVDPSVSPRHCVIASHDGRVTVRDLDRNNPTFVNGLPADDRPLENGDQIQVGGSLFVLRVTEDVEASAERVAVTEHAPPATTILVMRREDVFADAQIHRTASPARLSRDLGALIRATAAMSAVRGLVALQWPVIELIADAMPASRAVFVPVADGQSEIGSAVGWRRGATTGAPVQVSRPLIERVIRDVVGILSEERIESEPPAESGLRTRSVLAAPLVAFDKVVGALVLQADGPEARFDEGHLRLLMAIAGIAATAFEHARQVEWLEDTNRALQAALNRDHNMVGESDRMRDVYRRIARVAPTDSTVLITGESGTGKELVARAIHRNSPRADRQFVAINCAAITETLLESELFGHEKGAFTGAIAQKKGKLETAEGGTVFLDEIGELSLALQAKLLRVLQEKEFERVGGTRQVRVDFRLVAATNRDLKSAIDSGGFRRDLYYRLNVVSLAIPPLRERRGDIPLLASSFLRRHSDKAKRQVLGFSPEALACLMAYDWPGNVRELENAVEHAVVLGQDSWILFDDLPDAVAEAAPPAAPATPATGGPATLHFHDAIKQTKRDLIARALDQAGGHYTAAARLLELHPNYLHRLIRNLQMKPAQK